MLSGDSKKDKTYQPPRRARRDEDEDSHADDPLYGSDGAEYIAPSSDEEEDGVGGEDGGEDGDVNPAPRGKKVSLSFAGHGLIN